MTKHEQQTNNGQITTQKTKDWGTGTPLTKSSVHCFVLIFILGS